MTRPVCAHDDVSTALQCTKWIHNPVRRRSLQREDHLDWSRTSRTTEQLELQVHVSVQGQGPVELAWINRFGSAVVVRTRQSCGTRL